MEISDVENTQNDEYYHNAVTAMPRYHSGIQATISARGQGRPEVLIAKLRALGYEKWDVGQREESMRRQLER